MERLSLLCIVAWIAFGSFYYGMKVGFKKGSINISCHKAFE